MSKTRTALKIVEIAESIEVIPLVKADLPTFEELTPAFKDILNSKRVSNFGKYNSQFEADTSKYLGCETATVSSGTLGLIFSLQALGVEPGDKVLLPSFTFMATAQAILYCGGIPIFAEIEEDMTLSPSDVERQLEQYSDLRFIIGVHTYGLPARVEALEKLAKHYSKKRSVEIKILYDAAHAFGSSVGDRKVGTFGDAEVFSLSATKALVTIEGGLVCSRNGRFIERIRKMRNYGIQENYNAHYPGLNGKMSEFHAVFGVLNLKKLDAGLALRQEKARYYTKAIESRTSFKAFPAQPNGIHTFKDFTIKLSPEFKNQRASICKFLTDQGIENRAYFFPPVHEQKYFERFKDRPLPRTEDLSRRVITLPFFTTMTEAQMDRVAEALQRAEAQFTR